MSIDYKQYIKSAEWRLKRRELINELGSQYSRCGFSKRYLRSLGRHLQVHHLHYDTLGCERPEDVMILCNICHKKEHE
jgi:5-methylcytosine-specific restriction endonuclease McrA